MILSASRANLCSAGCQPAVSPNAIRQDVIIADAPGLIRTAQIVNPRHSRVALCATGGADE
jgi:hypothetical protein